MSNSAAAAVFGVNKLLKYGPLQLEGTDEEFLKVIPDFIAEVRSGSDSLAKLKGRWSKPGWLMVYAWSG